MHHDASQTHLIKFEIMFGIPDFFFFLDMGICVLYF